MATVSDAVEEVFRLAAESPDVRRFLSLFRRVAAYQRKRWPTERGFEGAKRLSKAVEIASLEGAEEARGFFFATCRQLTGTGVKAGDRQA